MSERSAGLRARLNESWRAATLLPVISSAVRAGEDDPTLYRLQSANPIRGTATLGPLGKEKTPIKTVPASSVKMAY